MLPQPSQQSYSKSLAYIIADIHLQPNQPEHPINQHFIQFIEQQAPQVASLYILGDLFEVWLGDDIGLQDYKIELAALKKLIDQGTQVFVQYGNRDFLMKKSFFRSTGIQQLPDEYPAEIGPHKILMLHGDQLCTHDEKYQKVRRWFRNPMVQWILLHLSQKRRKKIGQAMRKKSQQAGQQKSMEIMDVAPKTVIETFNRYPDYPVMIHGHTHRPDVHDLVQNDHAKTRYVLGDWRPDTVYISVTETEIEVHRY